jgi:hypothetical protein
MQMTPFCFVRPIKHKAKAGVKDSGIEPARREKVCDQIAWAT